MATTEELQEHTVAELKEMAEKQGVDVPSHATKDEIIKAIQANPEGQAEVTPLTTNPTTVILPLADTVADLYGIGKKYNLSLADIQSGGAFTQASFQLDILPAGAIIGGIRIKHTQSVAGAGPISACTAQVSTANNTYGTAFDVFQAVSATALATVIPGIATPFQALGVALPCENFAATTPILVTLIATGGNLGGATAGAISIWIRYYLIA
jgi:hypothetical protein